MSLSYDVCVVVHTSNSINLTFFTAFMAHAFWWTSSSASASAKASTSISSAASVNVGKTKHATSKPAKIHYHIKVTVSWILMEEERRNEGVHYENLHGKSRPCGLAFNSIRRSASSESYTWWFFSFNTMRQNAFNWSASQPQGMFIRGGIDGEECIGK